MRKFLIIGLMLGLCACQTTAKTSNTSLSVCLTNKAYAALSDGSLLTTELKTLASDISTSCLKQLALEKAGLNDESLNAATTLLTALKNSKTQTETTK